MLILELIHLQENSLNLKVAYFTNRPLSITIENEIKEKVQFSIQDIIKKIGQWVSEGSGWRIDKIDGHLLNIVKYKPTNGSIYIQLPPELRNPLRGLINL